MTELADFFPGFSSEWIATTKGRVFARVGGSGPPLILLHGFPQTHVMWHRVAPALAKHFMLVIPDLPGYGWSDIPETDEDHLNFSKRAFAATMVEVMDKLGPGHCRCRFRQNQHPGAPGCPPDRQRRPPAADPADDVFAAGGSRDDQARRAHRAEGNG